MMASERLIRPRKNRKREKPSRADECAIWAMVIGPDRLLNEGLSSDHPAENPQGGSGQSSGFRDRFTQCGKRAKLKNGEAAGIFLLQFLSRGRGLDADDGSTLDHFGGQADDYLPSVPLDNQGPAA